MNELLQQLSQRNIKLSLVDDQLKVNAPKGALTLELRNQLVSNKASLVALLQAQNAARRDSHIPRIDRDEQALSSHAQQRIWFVSQFEQARAAYNINIALSLQGSVDEALLERCFAEIVKRHDILRTRFVADNGLVIQQVLERVDWQLDKVDVSDTQTLDAMLQQSIEQPFDLDELPLFRLTLYRLDAEQHVLLLILHHIVADGWSLGVIVNELSSLYNHYRQHPDKQDHLPPLSIQYRDYAAWQRERLAGGEFKRQLDYWQRNLDGLPPLLELPTDRPRPAEQSFNGAIASYRLDQMTQLALHNLANAQDVTLFMLLLTVFELMLAKYCNRDDIAVGTPVANRSRAEIEALIGMFVNTLVLRNDFSGEPRFCDLLQRVKQSTLEAYDCQEVPFDYVLDVLQPERSASHAPLVQVMFVLQNMPIKPLSLSGLTLAPYKLGQTTAKFDLTLTLEETAEGLLVNWEYNTDLFVAETIARFQQHFELLVQGVLANPQCPIGELNMLTEQETELLGSGWGQPPKTFVQTLNIAERFDRSAERFADAVALRCQEKSVTYEELAQNANRVANRLIELGVTPGARIGLYSQRSIELVTAILAIVKTGAAYVPLDPSYPAERINYIIEDSALKLVISDTELPSEVMVHRPLVLLLDEQLLGEGDCREVSVKVPVQAGAYVIYTSGSTGQPKGVSVTHGNVGRLFDATEQYYGFNHQDVWSFFHSYAFDFSVWEIWGALFYGGCVEIVPYWLSRDTEAFYRLVCQKGVTVLNQTPSAFRQFIQQDNLQQGQLSLRYVIFGGEALDPAMLRPWYEKHGDTRPQLVNMYGITETTVHVTLREMNRQTLDSKASVIGRPIDDLGIVLLDSHYQLVPQGVIGEIYVSGAGLSGGYLNRPDLTAERFLPNPYGAPGSRLYKTGDIGRYLPGGEVEYLGRNDSQVKIRGFRIELGEIEAQVGGSEGIAEALVTVRNVASSDRLVAYVVPQNGAEGFDCEAFKQQLMAHLPEHMVPTYIIALDEFKLTINGKIDQRALPLPDIKGSIEQHYQAPSGPLEQVLAEVWQQVLSLARVGVNDNYFSLGGDSIQVIQLIAAAKKRGLDFSIQMVFQNPTVRRLAKAISSQEHHNDVVLATEPFSLIDEQDRVLLPDNVVDAYPISQLQEGIFYHSQLGLDKAIYHNVTSTKVEFAYDPEAFRQAMSEVFRRHPMLRTGFEYEGYSRPLQLVYQSVDLPLEICDISELGELEQQRKLKQVFAEQVNKPFELSKAPLVRVLVYKLSESSLQFVLVEHHAIFDGWSVQNFCNELLATYRQFLDNRFEPEPPLSCCYRDFVAAEQAAIDSVETRQWWQHYLEDFEAIQLPRYPAGQCEPNPIRFYNVPVSDELMAALESTAQSLGVQLKNLFLAANAKVLGLLSGQSKVTFGITSHGRVDHEQASKVLGMFASSIPARVDLSGGSWRELINRFVELETAIQPHKRFPVVEQQALVGGQELSDVLFTFTDFAKAGDEPNAEDFSQKATQVQTENNFAIEVVLEKALTTGKLNFMLDVAPDVYLDGGVETMGGYYLRCLQAIAASVDAPHEQTPLLGEAHTRELLTRFNDTHIEFEPLANVHAMFERQVEVRGDATAIIFDGQSLSYRDCNARANRLAHHLIAAGVRPDDKVGLFLDRSAEMVIALLAILKAGAAYVPLDPALPAERVVTILNDLGEAKVVTESAKMSVVAQSRALAIVVDDPATEQALSHGSADNPDLVACGADNLAYVLYTSGSTGEPKSIGMGHGPLVNLIRAMKAQDSSLDKAHTLIQFASIGFDMSFTDIFLALSGGGRLIVLRPDQQHSLVQITDLIRQFDVSALNLPFAMLQSLAEDYQQGGVKLPMLEVIVSTAEALKITPAVRAFFNDHPNCRLINHYGPSETHVVTARAMEGACSEWPEVPDIGKAIANTRCYIVDSQLNPVPVGVVGLLLVGGDCLARGYLNRPELTAEKFFEHQFTGMATQRLYNTGDLVRYLPDGNIDYVGRVDHQVKIHGFRIELGEIDARLMNCQGVNSSVVVVHQDDGGDKRLLAYVTAEPGKLDGERAEQQWLAQLRSSLQSALPHYMVPSEIILLEKMPLNTNGKVDRRALPAPQAWACEYVAPVNDTERCLQHIWQQLLDLDEVSTEANFFSLGGHSLLAMRLISSVAHQFGVEIGLPSIFAAPTIKGLAAIIDSSSKSDIDDIPAVERSEPLPLSYAQKRMWLIDQVEMSSEHYHLPHNLEFKGRLNLQAMQQALDEIVARHEILRTVYQQHQDDVIQVIQPVRPLAVNHHDLSDIPAEQQMAALARYSAQENSRSFDLSSDLMLRVSLLRLSPEHHVVLVNMHHIASDGWSLAILTREFIALYEAFDRQQPNPLPPLAIGYADFAYWQRKTVPQHKLDEQLSYWKTRLAGLPELHSLPLDHPRPEHQSFDGAGFYQVLDGELPGELEALAQRYQSTLFMVLQSAYALLLSKFSGSNDIVFGTPVAGRPKPQLESLIGCFLNTVVFRNELSGIDTFEQLLVQTRQHSLEAYANQDLPFETLVEALSPSRSLSYNPLFQLWFTMQNQDKAELTLPGVSIGHLSLGKLTTQFDLQLSASVDRQGDNAVLALNWVYVKQLFDPSTIEYLSKALASILKSIVEAPKTPLAQIELPDRALLDKVKAQATKDKLKSKKFSFSKKITKRGE